MLRKPGVFTRGRKGLTLQTRLLLLPLCLLILHASKRLLDKILLLLLDIKDLHAVAI